MYLIPHSWSHLHILISVFPSVGLLFVLGFYITAVATNNEIMKRSCLALFIVLGLIAIPTYMSGVGSMEALTGKPGVSQDMMNSHYYVGLAGLAILVAT